MRIETAARGLGLTSLAIGLTELAAPRQIEKLMGVNSTRTTALLRVLGVREVLHGVDLLTHRDPVPGLWGRVAGDLLDGTLLGIATRQTRRPMGLAAVMTMVLGVVAADIFFAGKSLSRA